MTRHLDPARIQPFPETALARDVNENGAPYVVTPVGLDAIERLAASGGSDTAIAGAMKIDRATFRSIKSRQPEVNEALARGRATLDLELTHNLLHQARNGNALAAVMLGKTRLAWRDGGRAGDDEAERKPEEEIDVDWSRVPLAEREFLLLALTRVDELRSGPYKPPTRLLRLMTEQEAAVLDALRLTPHERRQEEARLLTAGDDPIEPPSDDVAAEHTPYPEDPYPEDER